MKVLAVLLVAVAAFAAGTSLAQQPTQGRGAQAQKQSMQPREDRREFHRERRDRREHFSREERDKLRQDLLDANREMKGRK